MTSKPSNFISWPVSLINVSTLPPLKNPGTWRPHWRQKLEPGLGLKNVQTIFFLTSLSGIFWNFVAPKKKHDLYFNFNTDINGFIHDLLHSCGFWMSRITISKCFLCWLVSHSLVGSTTNKNINLSISRTWHFFGTQRIWTSTGRAKASHQRCRCHLVTSRLEQLKLFTLPETNSSHLKMDGWNTTFLLGPGLFSGANC